MFESILPLEPKVTFPVKRIIEEGDQVWIWAEVVGWGKTKESIDMWVLEHSFASLDDADLIFTAQLHVQGWKDHGEVGRSAGAGLI